MTAPVLDGEVEATARRMAARVMEVGRPVVAWASMFGIGGLLGLVLFVAGAR